MLYSVVGSYCTTKSISYTYTYIPSFLDFLPFWIKQSPVLYCGSHGFSTLYIVSVAYICQSRSPNSSHAPWCPYVCYLCLCLYFCFAKKIIYIISLDSTPVLNILSFPGFVNQTLFKKEREIPVCWIQTTDDDHSDLTRRQNFFLRAGISHHRVDRSS